MFLLRIIIKCIFQSRVLLVFARLFLVVFALRAARFLIKSWFYLGGK